MIVHSADKIPVVIGEGSHVLDHNTLVLFEEALGQVRLEGEAFFLRAVDMGRVIGTNACVRVEGHDSRVYYARRGGRAGASRMVRGISPTPCTTLVLCLGWDPDAGHHVAYTAYVGEVAPREPWDPSLQEDPAGLAESRKFWAAHALVDDGSTELEICEVAEV